MGWGQVHLYKQEIGVGECAGVILDLVGTLVNDGKEKLEKSQNRLKDNAPSDAIYYAYAAFVIGAKAILLSEDIKCNTHKGIISDFQKEIVETGKLDLGYNYSDRVLSINAFEPTIDFANDFVNDAENFLSKVVEYRSEEKTTDKEVIKDYYTA